MKYLRAVKVSLQEYEFPVNKIKNIGAQMLALIEQNYYLNKSARDAYRSYLMSYASHSHKVTLTLTLTLILILTATLIPFINFLHPNPDHS